MKGLRIGLVVYRTVEVATHAACIALSKAYPQADWEHRGAADVSPSRNSIVQSFLATKDQWLLLLDSDMLFSPADLPPLHKALKQDPMIGAISAYYIRWTDGLPVHNWLNGEGQWVSDEERLKRSHELSGIQPVDSFGGGFLLIRRDALEAVRPPWFQAGYNQIGAYIGNDTFLCQKLKNNGFHPSVHLDVAISHIGRMTFRPKEVTN